MSWCILTSHVAHDGEGRLSVTICHHRPNGYGVFWLAGKELPTSAAARGPAGCSGGQLMTVLKEKTAPAKAASPARMVLAAERLPR